MEVAVIPSLPGPGPGLLRPEVGKVGVSADAALGFGEAFLALVETTAIDPCRDDVSGEQDAGEVPVQVPPMFAETALVLPVNARWPNGTVADAESPVALLPVSFSAAGGSPAQAATPEDPVPELWPDMKRGSQMPLRSQVGPEPQAEPIQTPPKSTPPATDSDTIKGADKAEALPDPQKAAVHAEIPPPFAQESPGKLRKGDFNWPRLPNGNLPAHERGQGIVRRSQAFGLDRPHWPHEGLPPAWQASGTAPDGETEVAAVIGRVMQVLPDALAGSAPAVAQGEARPKNGQGAPVWRAEGSAAHPAGLWDSPAPRPMHPGAPKGVAELPNPDVAVFLSDPLQPFPEARPDGGVQPAHGTDQPGPRGFCHSLPASLHNPHPIGLQLAKEMPVTAGQQVEITLSPEELGKVRMTLSSVDGGLTMLLVADRPETLDLMRRHIDQLARDFRDMGFELLTFAFADGQGDRAPPDQPQAPDPLAEADPVSAPGRSRMQVIAPTHFATPNDRLDLRL